MFFKANAKPAPDLVQFARDARYQYTELLKMNDEVPAASLKEYLELADVKELPSVEVHSSEVLKVVLADMELLKGQVEDIRKEADEVDDYAVVSAMEGDLEQYSKTIWFLKAMLK